MLFIYFMLFYFLPNVAFGAGFDCKKAKSEHEILICMDYRLSDLDSQMNQIYSAKLAKSLKRGQLRYQQQLWIKERSKCLKFECFVKSYLKQMAKLSPDESPDYELKNSYLEPWEYMTQKNEKLYPSIFLNGNGVVWLETHDLKGHSRKFINYATMETKVADSYTFEVAKIIGNTQPLRNFGKYQVGNAPGNYGGCLESLADFGLQVTEANSTLKSHIKSKRLIALKQGNFKIYRSNSDCNETELKIEPLSFYQSVIVENSIFLIDEDFALRFDDSLYTSSKLLGTRVFLVWNEDLIGLIGDECNYEKRVTENFICVDNKLQRLTNLVHGFYN